MTIFIFKFLHVPFSMVMLEREINAWLSSNFSYVSRSGWVEINAISPNMLVAVIAVEDQNFPNHWGFDFQAIESTINQNSASKKPIRGASTIA
ncbi:MAG TPA: transglycosylase domain-containing protein [Arsenophonus sp.]